MREVFWPPVKSQAKLQNFLRRGSLPEHDKWVLCGIKRCFFSSDDYENANKKLKLLEVTSDVQTEPEEESRRKRKRVPRKLYSESEDSEENELLPPPPRIVSKPKYTGATHPLARNGLCSQDESLSQIENSESTCSTPKSNLCYPATSTNLEHSLEVSQARTSYESPGNISFEQSSLQKQLEESSFQIKLFKQLKFIQEQNSQILAIVKKHPPSAILPKINILPENLPCDFPIKNQENLQELEVYLLDNQNFSCLVAYLAAIGGKDLTTQVNNVLRRLLSNDLASQFSFYGKRSNKKAFSTLKTKDLVIAAVKQCSKEAKFKDIENSMKVWLKHAPHRYRIEIAKQTADL
ncbi:hypothetical protein RN001_008478 [Aquatica leii]|uniref:DUF4806 domain-containing protein n=1 Tax=Aquatica leii TaxID=1421715 RepID=A0AAN7P9P3_9COLE|nr:hypothetical protein RN001_008478 [Aquatica leii]